VSSEVLSCVNFCATRRNTSRQADGGRPILRGTGVCRALSGSSNCAPSGLNGGSRPQRRSSIKRELRWIARRAALGGVWCEARDGEELVLILPTANSPRGFGSSDGKCLFFFGFDVSEERVREDVRERVRELGVHCEKGRLLVVR
jgi:hypothetical protein